MFEVMDFSTCIFIVIKCKVKIESGFDMLLMESVDQYGPEVNLTGFYEAIRVFEFIMH